MQPLDTTPGAPSPSANGDTRLATLSSLSSGHSGDNVRTLQWKLAHLGAAIPADEQGSGTFGEATRQAVANVQRAQGLPPSGVVDTATAAAIDAAVAIETYIVTGTVASHNSAGVGGLEVQIVDKNIPTAATNGTTDIAMAQAVTDDLGRWTSQFDSRVLLARHKLRPDLQARVFAGKTFLAASDVRYNASTQETLDVLLPAGSTALPSEHDLLTTAVAVHYGGRLADLQESSQRSDITYLANKTGWDARAVAMAALADQLSQSPARDGTAAPPPIHPAFYYALLRAGVPADPPSLYQTDAQTVSVVWKSALDSGVIPATLAQQVPAALETYQRLRAAVALDTRALSGASTLGEMVQVSLGADVQRQQQFADLYARFANDPPKLWDAVTQQLGADTARQLQLDGQLARLTLNNASVVAQLHQAEGQTPLASSLDLAQRGYYRADKWSRLVGEVVPQQVPGATVAEKRANYAELLAAQVRVSFPTAVVTDMVKTGALPVATDVRDGVTAFLSEHQGAFEIGLHPFEQFLAQNKLGDAISAPVKAQIKAIQRVYQITPNDAAMAVLLQNKLDSAYQIVRYGVGEFVQSFQDQLGGESVARQVYGKAHQLHNAVLNIAVGYLTTRRLPALGANPDAMILAPAPASPPPADAAATDVVAYPTLESLFGSLDYCACAECHSILGPAAYLVDLLQFVDRPHNEKENPQAVLFERRPDIQHLPLTCENTNTPLPYIDLVNEILEYFVVHNLSLVGYTGHDTGSVVTAAELLANPQFVVDAAYDTLKTASFPPPLPFHRQLEALRRYTAAFGVPLAAVMEALRSDDALERPTPATYAWRDILLERLGLSRAEYALLGDPTSTLASLFGFPPATTDAGVLANLANVKAFARRADVSFEDLTALLRTRFVNPNSALIPKLERLGVPFSTLKKFKDGALSDAGFDAQVPTTLDPTEYGGNVKAWVKDPTNYAHIMGLITIANPSDATALCSFDQLEFRYANPDNNANALQPIDYYRMGRFIRLWKKLGWTIPQSDAAMSALYPDADLPDGASLAADLQRLEAGFAVLIPRLGLVRGILDSLQLDVDRDLSSLLACWSPIDTHGDDALYRRLFLSPSLLAQDAVFADDGYGHVLRDATQKLLAHGEALRAAFNLTAAELGAIVTALGFDATTGLTLENISAVFRRGWLARQLRISVVELLALTRATGLDPFQTPDAPDPDVVRLIALVQNMRNAGLRPVQALYLVWNIDLSGRSAPDDGLVTGFARTLRGAFAGVEGDFALVDDPNGDVARARMALVYGAATTDFLFGLLNGTLTVSVPYGNPQPALDPAIVAAGPGLGYDDLRKQLTFTGVLSATTRDALLAVPGVSPAFATAVNALFASNQAAVGPFFDKFPELLPLYVAYAASADPPQKKRAALLAAILPQLKKLRKQQQALAALTTATAVNASYTQALVTDAAVMAASADPTAPALDDLTALDAPGLLAQFFWSDTATGTPDRTDVAAPLLDYAAGSDNHLPANPTAGRAISAVWSGYLEVPQSGYYNLAVDADAGASVSLSLAGGAVPLASTGATFSNTSALSLAAGTLYPVTLTVNKTTATMRLRWETTGRGWQVVPSAALYSTALVDHVRGTFVRFLKATALASALNATAVELADLARNTDLSIGGRGWLNALAVSGQPDGATAQTLRDVLQALLDVAHLKAALAPGSDRLRAVLANPVATLADGSSPLLSLTGWDGASLDALLAHFGTMRAGLAHVTMFRRVFDAYAIVSTFGIAAAALIAATTNDPDSQVISGLQSALRARYAEADWLAALRPVSDTLRARQRDALVAYILQKLSENPATSAIDTPDKLYEYFLVDPQMDPCMQTSRIRLALSAVQLFIERCLMNLERRVAASSIQADQWEWMKRYRVWQANREVFLWPENWLEPELRDDQTSFFKQTMSELLQNDVTEDTAATGLLNYLARLEEVARLEPCGIYYAEGDTAAGAVAHVIGRTAGAHRKYYYRRREFGYWTPWEEIKLDIEDNPVIPVVWNGRLLLVWLRILKQTPVDPQTVQARSNTPGKLSDLTLDAVRSDARSAATSTAQLTIQAMLCYSEYYNGKWQPTKTSDPDAPTTLGSFAPLGFDRSWLRLGAYVENDALRIDIWGNGSGSYVLYNTHSAPVRQEDAGDPTFVNPWQWRYLENIGGTLMTTYDREAFTMFGWGVDGWGGTELTRSVLRDPIPFTTIEPNHSLRNVWDAPFFLHDSRYAFYVTTSEALVSISKWAGYGVAVSVPKASVAIPPLVLQPVPNFNPIPDPIGPVSTLTNPGVVDRAPVEKFVATSPTIRAAISSTAAVSFGGQQIGVAGGLGEQQVAPGS